MKKVVLILTIGLASCGNDPLSMNTTNNAEIQVQFMFEYEGVRVYRFHDGLRYIYYTNTTGNVQWSEIHNNGKTTTTTNHNVSIN